jgi:hypothetical protein
MEGWLAAQAAAAGPQSPQQTTRLAAPGRSNPTRLQPPPQVGRAGRDGREGRCVLLLDDGDYLLLRALAHGSTVLPRAVSAFLSEHVFGDEDGGGGASHADVAEAARQQGGRCKCAGLA